MARNTGFLDRNHPDYAAHKELLQMKYQDLQAAVISRGMDFNDVVEGDHGKLSSWFVKNYNKKMNRGLLEDFDLWVDGKLGDRGYQENDPIRQYKRFSMLDEEGGIKVTQSALNRAKIKKEKPKKRTRDSRFGIFTGTKKELTYNLTQDLIIKLGDKYTNKELQKKFSDKMVIKVQTKFPGAIAKSIKIWMSRALKKIRNA